MKYRLKHFFLSSRLLSIGILLGISFAGFWGHHHYFSQPLSGFLPSPQELASRQLGVSALSSQSAWDQEFLSQNPLLKEKIVKYERGMLCKSLKELDNKTLTHQQMLSQLEKLGFVCTARPLAVNPFDSPLRYLKIDGTIAQNPDEKGVARQEICQSRLEPACVVRIKRDGFPLNRRSAPHSTKAVLRDVKADPGSYDNEAFKVGSHGQPIPKGPSATVGLKKCPYKDGEQEDEASCRQWINALMEEAHPSLREPRGTTGNS